MRAMLVAFLATAVIAVGADFLLDQAGYSTIEKTSGAAVRID
ncbi:MAG: hypothetical protein OXI87_01915 [Albidovulum sp.]|nr:hypothetical protein [Albidovulum sp.]MDE0533132.1 hypothetical protein [Albidovulum sp.]